MRLLSPKIMRNGTVFVSISGQELRKEFPREFSQGGKSERDLFLTQKDTFTVESISLSVRFHAMQKIQTKITKLLRKCLHMLLEMKPLMRGLCFRLGSLDAGLYLRLAETVETQ